MKKCKYVFPRNQKGPNRAQYAGLPQRSAVVRTERVAARGEEIAALQPVRARRMCHGAFFILYVHQQNLIWNRISIYKKTLQKYTYFFWNQSFFGNHEVQKYI